MIKADLTSLVFWKAALNRAGRTAAQALLGVLVGATIVSLDWADAGATVGTAVLVSLLTSMVSGLPEADPAAAQELIDQVGRHDAPAEG